jgi:hypothetical protein
MIVGYETQECRDAMDILKRSPPGAQIWAALNLVKHLSRSEAILGVAARHHLQRVVEPLQVAMDFFVYDKQLQEEASREETA